MGMNVHSKSEIPQQLLSAWMPMKSTHYKSEASVGFMHQFEGKKKGFSSIKATYQGSQRLFGVLEQAKACAGSCSSYHLQHSASVVSLPL